MALHARWQEQSSLTIKVMSKPCPKCRSPTERDGGCMHMECTRCNFQWCWICQSKWTRDCMASHWFTWINIVIFLMYLFLNTSSPQLLKQNLIDIKDCYTIFFSFSDESNCQSRFAKLYPKTIFDVFLSQHEGQWEKYQAEKHFSKQTSPIHKKMGRIAFNRGGATHQAGVCQ